MKKFLLSAAFVAVSMMAAQAADFTVGYSKTFPADGYTTINNGDKIFIDEVEELVPSRWYQMAAYLRTENLTDNTLDMTVSWTRDEEESTLMEGYIQLCVFGSCRTDNVVTGALQPHQVYSGPGEALEYVFNPGSAFDIEDVDYCGTAYYDVTVSDGKSDVKFKVLFSHNDPEAGIEGVATDATAAAVYYNLQGVQVANPQSGNIYIKKQGAKTTKVVM